MIINATFDFIRDIWQKNLWTERTSDIQSHSALLLNAEPNMQNFLHPASYFIYILNNKVAGCNSGHKCCDNSYRSRGLFVFPEYRGQGIGQKLLEASINQGRREQCNFIWSYPREQSWTTYKSMGFVLTGGWSRTETGSNAFCTLKY